ncbi:PIN domain-containing protein [Nonomuraea glycinis]|uniref:Ribonuclease VapC n=1 Tax=Nonomuraea glycinis TaxID=2047744 RepID=A0A918A1R8_9ACTN|nr:PIN domain-containing protein [Nonomuraea glycinis]MCA2177059.1 PIN domain-containing protein [Nonomuraea glycinis]GGP02747.1 ribonuclease VapC [Nonomuraea glycinis]
MIICDTGPLVALFNEADDDHERCLAFLERHPGPLVIPAPVLTEVCWLVESRVGAEVEAQFLQSIVDGVLTLEAVTTQDLSRMADLIRTYADFPLGAADASVVAVAERLKVHEIATLDRRHFHVVKPQHVNAFTLLP